MSSWADRGFHYPTKCWFFGVLFRSHKIPILFLSVRCESLLGLALDISSWEIVLNCGHVEQNQNQSGTVCEGGGVTLEGGNGKLSLSPTGCARMGNK